mgnify:CR=1 FL=1
MPPFSPSVSCKSRRKSNLNLLLDFIEKDIECTNRSPLSRAMICSKARADVVRRFMKAYTEGIRYYKSQKKSPFEKPWRNCVHNDRAIGEFDYNQRVRALPDDAKPTIKGMQLALDDIAKDNPKAKNSYDLAAGRFEFHSRK